jgi:hypothetical protein
VTSWRLAAQQAAEKLAAGPAFESSGYVVADELGQPVNPDWYSDEFQRLRKARRTAAGKLHEAGATRPTA